jgi:hypothetical protein
MHTFHPGLKNCYLAMHLRQREGVRDLFQAFAVYKW